jgi:hypothetical protein
MAGNSRLVADYKNVIDGSHPNVRGSAIRTGEIETDQCLERQGDGIKPVILNSVLFYLMTEIRIEILMSEHQLIANIP